MDTLRRVKGSRRPNRATNSIPNIDILRRHSNHLTAEWASGNVSTAAFTNLMVMCRAKIGTQVGYAFLPPSSAVDEK